MLIHTDQHDKKLKTDKLTLIHIQVISDQSKTTTASIL